MKKLQLLLVCIIVVGISNSSAQEIKRLFIGDTVPDIVFNQTYNYSGVNKKLSDFKGKFVILDFWNKSCTNCIAAFPHLQHLQQEFKEDVQILLITSDTFDRLKNLFDRSLIIKNTELPMVFGDTILSRMLFPHIGNPYHVWLDREGIVRATTSGEAATSDNIRDLISKKNLNVPVREDLLDVDINNTTSILEANNGRYLKYLLYYKKNIFSDNDSLVDNTISSLATSRFSWASTPHSVIMKRIEGVTNIGAISSLRNAKSDKKIGFRLFNSVPNLYSFAYNAPLGTKVIMEERGHEYYQPKNATSLEWNKWFDNYYFIYELLLNEYDERIFKDIMKRDLFTFFGMNGKFVSKDMPCLVLIKTTKDDRLASSGKATLMEDTKGAKGYVFRNTSFGDFINRLLINSLGIDEPVFFDETGISPEKRIDMEIKVNWNDIPALNQALVKYGLVLKEEVRKIQVLKLSK